MRYAGIRATSAKLHTMCITREEFERALGCKLEDIVPDDHRLDLSEVVEALRKVDLFGGLNDGQLKRLAAQLTHSEFTFKHGEWVFRQNEEGDAFYVITSGTAEVIRRHDDEVDENGNVTRHHHAHRLAELREWHSFGERSLIKNQIRYAGIRATSDILKCCRIDREQFEQALGPLEKVLPDQYRYISGGNFSGFFQASTR